MLSSRVKSALQPAPYPTAIRRVLVRKGAAEIALFTRDDSISHYQQHREQQYDRPQTAVEYCERQIEGGETDVHWITSEAIRSSCNYRSCSTIGDYGGTRANELNKGTKHQHKPHDQEERDDCLPNVRRILWY